MKALLTSCTIVTLLVSLTPAFAESEGRKRDKKGPEWSPEIRERFHAARKKAMEDPEIKQLQVEAHAANDKFFQATRKKMSEIDPGLTEIVRNKRGGQGDQQGLGPEDKNRKDPRQKKSDRPDRKERPGGPNSPRSGFGSLDDSERQSLQAARKAAQADPAVQAALAKKEAATSPEDREAAGEEYRQTIHAAMVKADPSIEPILKKLASKPKGPSGPKPDQEPPMDGEMMP